MVDKVEINSDKITVLGPAFHIDDTCSVEMIHAKYTIRKTKK